MNFWPTISGLLLALPLSRDAMVGYGCTQVEHIVLPEC